MAIDVLRAYTTASISLDFGGGGALPITPSRCPCGRALCEWACRRVGGGRV